MEKAQHDPRTSPLFTCTPHIYSTNSQLILKLNIITRFLNQNLALFFIKQRTYLEAFY